MIGGLLKGRGAEKPREDFRAEPPSKLELAYSLESGENHGILLEPRLGGPIPEGFSRIKGSTDEPLFRYGDETVESSFGKYRITSQTSKMYITFRSTRCGKEDVSVPARVFMYELIQR